MSGIMSRIIADNDLPAPLKSLFEPSRLRRLKRRKARLCRGEYYLSLEALAKWD